MTIAKQLYRRRFADKYIINFGVFQQLKARDNTPNFINFHPELDGDNSPLKFSTLQLSVLNNKLNYDGD